MLAVVVLLAYGLVFSAPLTFALGTKCSAAIASGTAAASAPFWLENITHQGISAFNPDPSSYTVFRNVKDYGATGDGTTDDTDAIKFVVLALPEDSYLSAIIALLSPTVVDVVMRRARPLRSRPPSSFSRKGWYTMYYHKITSAYFIHRVQHILGLFAHYVRHPASRLPLLLIFVLVHTTTHSSSVTLACLQRC